MYNAMVKHRNKKGFTLMEMLIVVAIIAILVAISVPVFTNQLTNAKTQTDAANVRAAKAVAIATYLTNTNPVLTYYIYDAANGTLVKSASDDSDIAAGYGQTTGITGDVIAIQMTADGVFSYQWVLASTQASTLNSGTGTWLS